MDNTSDDKVGFLQSVRDEQGSANTQVFAPSYHHVKYVTNILILQHYSTTWERTTLK